MFLYILSLALTAGLPAAFILSVRTAFSRNSSQSELIFAAAQLLLILLIIFVNSALAQSVVSKTAHNSQNALIERFFTLKYNYFRQKKQLLSQIFCSVHIVFLNPLSATAFCLPNSLSSVLCV